MLPWLLVFSIALSPFFVNAQCGAYFNTFNTTCSNGAVFFADSSFLLTPSNDTIIQEVWTWGDGKVDTISGNSFAGITHNYFSNGDYMTSLKVTTKKGCSTTFYKSINISLKPQVAFSIGSDERLCGYTNKLFTNQSAISSNDSLSLLWKFSDDSSTSNENIITKKYIKTEDYTAKLIVTAANACADSLTKPVSIFAIIGAGFKVQKRNICGSDSAVASITYRGSASGSEFLNYTVFWGDGTSITNSGTQTSFSHKYADTGKYRITLLYRTTTCNIYYYDSVYVSLAPSVKFSVIDTPGDNCGKQLVNFINQSSSPLNNPLTYIWTINGNNIGNATNPSYSFLNNAVYPISLKVIDSIAGCSRVFDTTVTITGASPLPVSKFAFETDLSNVMKYNFYDSSTIAAGASITSSKWNFGNGSEYYTETEKNVSNIYSQKGSYLVTLITTSNTGCSDTLKRLIVVDSVPVAMCSPLFLLSVSSCVGGTTTFVDSSYLKAGTDSLIRQIWDYGDGIKDTINSNFYYVHEHKYTVAGVYTATLTIFTKRGCSSSMSRTVTVRSTNANPEINFVQQPNCATNNQQVALNVSFKNIVGTITYKWIYGDGNSSLSTNNITSPPSQLYSYAPGNYVVKFLSRISACNGNYDTLTKTLTVLGKTKADFIYKIDEQNAQKVQFIDQSYIGINNITQHVWDFGDGATSSEKDPIHVYSSYGMFTVKHSFLTDISSCTADTATTIIMIDSMKTLPASISQSNMGTDFWAGYGYIENMKNKGASTNRPYFSLYLTASDNPATVLVDFPNMPANKKRSTGFPKVVYIPAKSSVEVTDFPIGDMNDVYNVNQLADTRLYFTGITERAIRITSNQPIAAWEHIYGINNTAGGTLLLPSKMWSTSYIVQSRGGMSNNTNPNSFFFVIADSDSTIIEFTPSNDIVDSSTATLLKDGHTAANVLYKAGNKYSILLNKGQVFNAMGYIAGAGQTVANAVDLSGTKIVSTNPFKKIAVFGGNGRVLINTTGCTNTTGSDNLIQQIFPKAVWGTKYLTAPTKTMETGIYRITVDDPSTTVTINGNTLSVNSLINQKYYELSSNQPLKIESDKRVMVTQYIVTPGCPSYISGNNGTGDPEMINLTPLKYGIKKATIFSPNFKNNANPSASYVNIIIRKEGLSSLTVDGQNLVDTGTTSYVSTGAYGSSGAMLTVSNASKKHPGDSNYVLLRFKVTTGASHSFESDSSFLAISYGMGNGESIGYNAGFNFNTIPVTYQYLGNGNWTNPINWLGNKIPPNPLPMGSEIIISGTCTLNVPQTIEDGARLVVETGGKLIVNGNLTIAQ